MSEEVRDHLQITLFGKNATKRQITPASSTKIEARMSELAINYVLSEGSRVIICVDGFSNDFLHEIVAKIGDEREETNLCLIPAICIPDCGPVFGCPRWISRQISC